MKTFIISRDGKEESRETVSDCETAADYVNRKFGSFDLAANKLTVTLEGEAAPAKPAAPAPKVVPAPEPKAVDVAAKEG